nr:hypothetical protein [Burkholderia pyrrocinia]
MSALTQNNTHVAVFANGLDLKSIAYGAIRAGEGVLEANSLLHGEQTDAFGDAGYQGVHKRPDARASVNWHVAMKPGKRRVLDKSKSLDALVDQVERINQGWHPGQGRAPVPGNQASVRLHQGPLSRAEEEHRATHCSVAG